LVKRKKGEEEVRVNTRRGGKRVGRKNTEAD
jgi:hypothetical protein